MPACHDRRHFDYYGRLQTALMADADPTSLIVFVHGFRGSPATTWGNFADWIAHDPLFCKSNVIFYSYESVMVQLSAAVDIFTTFMDFVASPAAVLPNRLAAPPIRARRYEKIVLVCHSLGGVIVRRALMNRAFHMMAAGTCDWSCRSSTVLFAPAQGGATPAKLLAQLSLSSNFIAGIGFAAKLRYPMIDDLDPSSAMIQALNADHQSLMAQAGLPFSLVPRDVRFGQYENVVHNVLFAGDPRHPPEPGQDHHTICKPTTVYRLPYQIVQRALV